MADTGSGFEWAGRIVIGYDGGNHEFLGTVLKCRSDGTLLLPGDQALHEHLHTMLDRILARTLREDLLACIPSFVEQHFPKNETAAGGGKPTPGRGEAAVLLTQFVMEFQEGPGVPPGP